MISTMLLQSVLLHALNVMIAAEKLVSSVPLPFRKVFYSKTSCLHIETFYQAEVKSKQNHVEFSLWYTGTCNC